ncbi:unnamed protein product, partial [Callosobruchus maculatus]
GRRRSKCEVNIVIVCYCYVAIQNRAYSTIGDEDKRISFSRKWPLSLCHPWKISTVMEIKVRWDCDGKSGREPCKFT